MARAQSVAELVRSYSGGSIWDLETGQFTFTSSGVIDFKRDQEMSGIWTVPARVKAIVIAAQVRVTGQFTFDHDCIIQGADPETSVIYGTDTPELLHAKKLDAGDDCSPYSAILGRGRITLNVRNLTTLNPICFMWTGKNGAKLHLDHVRGIDNRGGWHNHSDGISAAAGSTLRNCYLETGDDAIKLYDDILVEDTTIKMIRNCVPIQLGWGSYGDKAKGVFRNLTIIGEKGRGQLPAVIEGEKGNYRKSITIEGLIVTNPNAALVSLHEEGMALDLSVKQADISVKQFWGKTNGTCRSVINGSTEQTARYSR